MANKELSNNFEYDSDIDSFYIYNSQGEDVAGSVVIANFIYDINCSGQVIGLEIQNASEVFNVKPEFLLNADSAVLDVKLTKDMLFLGFVIVIGKQIFNFNNVVPRDKIVLTC